ncbi:unnamed protein product [Lactuca virosa]|uniref:Uncharacterized protein n=1 Tax=Lactuca virosa TaxID=75947 RepID=A0AAU9ND87_9ASTR|nr:unnamed protein product [Lactuca virosa]
MIDLFNYLIFAVDIKLNGKEAYSSKINVRYIGDKSKTEKCRTRLGQEKSRGDVNFKRFCASYPTAL